MAARVLRDTVHPPGHHRCPPISALLLQFSDCGRRRGGRFARHHAAIGGDIRRRPVKRPGGRRRLSAAVRRVRATAHAQVRDALNGRLDRVLEQHDLTRRTRARRAHPVAALATREIQLARGARHVHTTDRHAGGRRIHAVHVARGTRAPRVRPVTGPVAEPLDVALLARALRLRTTRRHQKLMPRRTRPDAAQLVTLARAVVEMRQGRVASALATWQEYAAAFLTRSRCVVFVTRP